MAADDIVDRRTRIGLVSRDRERVVAVADEFLALRG
jgi:glycerol-3-phosphate dehydrogenase